MTALSFFFCPLHSLVRGDGMREFALTVENGHSPAERDRLARTMAELRAELALRRLEGLDCLPRQKRKLLEAVVSALKKEQVC